MFEALPLIGSGNLVLMIFGILITLLDAYILVMLAYMIMSWMGPNVLQSEFGQIIQKITDPYLRFFRNIPWLRFGALNLGFLLGMMILYLSKDILTRILFVGLSPVGTVFLVITYVLNIMQWLVMLVGIFSLVRGISLFTSGRRHMFFIYLDQIIRPVASRFEPWFRSSRDPYLWALVVQVALSVGLYIGFNYMIAITFGLSMS